jgi:ketosteroid isomerase-like protein
VEIVRQMFDAFNRGDLEATLDFLAPEYEFRPSGLFMDTKDVYRGHEGWSEFWHAFHASWESMTISVERIENLGEQALVLGTLHGKGHGSGVEVKRQSAWFLTFHDGLCARIRAFANWGEGLEAAGLSE